MVGSRGSLGRDLAGFGYTIVVNLVMGIIEENSANMPLSRDRLYRVYWAEVTTTHHPLNMRFDYMIALHCRIDLLNDTEQHHSRVSLSELQAAVRIDRKIRGYQKHRKKQKTTFPPVSPVLRLPI